MAAKTNIGDFEIPKDYRKFTPSEKEAFCLILIETYLQLIEIKFKEVPNKLSTLKKLIEQTIIKEEAEENFEVCAVLMDMKKVINELSN